jgi:hypothetical protein
MDIQMVNKGFYYHHKYNPNGPINNCAYEVVAIGTHTETKDKLVVYRSLYETETQGGANYWLRPLEMFMENVMKDGKPFPRSQQINDQEIISELKKIRDEMYE